MRPIIAAFIVAAAASHVDAGPLGITAAEFRIGAVSDVSDGDTTFGPLPPAGAEPDLSLGFAAVNVAITHVHGLQLDAGLEGGADGATGRLAAHLFMTPRAGQKYGLFATLADLDETEATWGSLGAEAILSLGPTSSVELQGEIGYGTANLDWISAGARLAHETGTTTFHAGLDITEFDENMLSSIAVEASLGFETRLTQHAGIFGEVSQARLDGSDAAPELLLRAGASMTWGPLGGAKPETRLFRTTDPVAQLVRRGWY